MGLPDIKANSYFKGMLDTPSSYTGAAGQILFVNSSETGVEFRASGGLIYKGTWTPNGTSFPDETLIDANAGFFWICDADGIDKDGKSWNRGDWVVYSSGDASLGTAWSQYNPEYASMRWEGRWDNATVYAKNDVVTDAAWLAIGRVDNPAVGADPAPQRGTVMRLIDTTPAWATSTESDAIMTGIRVTADELGWLHGVVAWLYSDPSYRHTIKLYVEEAPGRYALLGEREIEQGSVSTDGWHDVKFDANILTFPNTVYVAAVEVVSKARDDIANGSQVFAGVSSTDPWWGAWSINAAEDRLKLHEQQTGGGGLFDLSGVQVGDMFEFSSTGGTYIYKVSSVDGLASSVYNYTVTVVSKNGTIAQNDVCSVVAMGSGGSVDYVTLPNGTAPMQYIQGVNNGTFDNNWYGVDLIMERAVLNPDWDLLSYAGSSVSGGGGGSVQPIKVNFIDLKDTPADYTGQAGKLLKVNSSENAVEFDNVLTNNTEVFQDVKLTFGNKTRQMIDLYSNTYGIGVESGTTYLRTSNYFRVYEGGTHTIGGANTGGDRIFEVRSPGIASVGKDTAAPSTPSNNNDLATKKYVDDKTTNTPPSNPAGRTVVVHDPFKSTHTGWVTIARVNQHYGGQFYGRTQFTLQIAKPGNSTSQGFDVVAMARNDAQGGTGARGYMLKVENVYNGVGYIDQVRIGRDGVGRVFIDAHFSVPVGTDMRTAFSWNSGDITGDAYFYPDFDRGSYIAAQVAALNTNAEGYAHT